MSEGSVEGFSDVSHTVNTHSKALEHVAVEEKGEMSTNDLNILVSILYKKCESLRQKRKKREINIEDESREIEREVGHIVFLKSNRNNVIVGLRLMIF